MISIDLLNRSGIWTSLADAIVTEMCLKDAGNESGNLRSVPKLEEDCSNFYPLQIVSNTHPQYKMKFIDRRLKKCQDRFDQLGKGKRWIRAAFKKFRREVHVISNVEESILEETSNGAEFHPQVQIVQSIHHFTNHKPSNDHGIVNRVCVDVTDIHVRRVDPRRLLGCYLNDYPNNEKIILKMVYETHIAGQLTMSVHTSSTYNESHNDHSATFIARNCPLAYRFVEIEVSNNGVITNIHFLPVMHNKVNGNPFTRSPWNRKESHVTSSNENRSEVQIISILLPTIITRNKLMMAYLNGRCQDIS